MTGRLAGAPLDLGAPGFEARAPAWRRASEALARALLAERERWVLWLPLALGAGTSFYFALRIEPASWIGPTALAAAAAAALVVRRHAPYLVASIALAAAALGLTLAQASAVIARAPPLDKRIGPASIEGRVVAASALPSGIRLLLEDVAIRGRDERALPRRVRITVRASGATAAPGDQVRVRAVLMPPPGPALPGAFDFQRKAFFNGLGTVGYAVGRIQLVEARSQSTIGDRVARLRQAISARVRASLPGSAGAIAATLMTGDRGGNADDR